MYRKTIFLFTIIMLLIGFGCITTQITEGGKETAQIGEQSMTITTEDKENICATFYPLPSPNAPGVVLLPDIRCDRTYFGNLPSKLNKAGFAVLAVDLRFKDLIAQV